MMTRKDYVATAQILNNLYLDLSVEDQEIVEEAVLAFADMFEADNPRFMREVFYNACYREEN